MQRRATSRAGDCEASIADALFAWYDRERRQLPWRAEPGEAPDPYKVWLSEIMLQQTTVKAVLPRYGLFLRSWPNVSALANADLGEVLAAWAGLGYYARARNLHACARTVVDRHGGRFPTTETELRTLPGIGDYTAAAIAAIAFGEPATPVDGNIERVVARLFAVTTPLPDAKAETKALAKTLTPKQRPGDLAQAMMDLGATLCTPRRPACGLCPVRSWCKGYADGLAEALPLREAKTERPVRRGAPSSLFVRTARCCFANGRFVACSAACWRRLHLPGLRKREAVVGEPGMRHSRRSGRGCPASSSTPSPISISSCPSIAPRSGSMSNPSARRTLSAAAGWVRESSRTQRSPL